jgi:hypothetical protein
MFYVYAHTKPNGEIFYIGKGQKDRYKDASCRNRHWGFIAKKHGFNPIILAEFETEKEALDEEVLLIAHFGKFKTLTNITKGGDANPMDVPDVAKQMAETKRAKGQYSGKEISEYNASFKERMKDPEFAKEVSEKRKKAAAASHAARRINGYGTWSDAAKQRCSERMKGENHPSWGKKRSAESRAKMSAWQIGKSSPLKGRSMSEEAKLNMKKAWVRRRQRQEAQNGQD